ncbi:MAG: hypothetical protein AAFR15_14315 [Cyanobacteria bacterium J06627_15]
MEWNLTQAYENDEIFATAFTPKKHSVAKAAGILGHSRRLDYTHYKIPMKSMKNCPKYTFFNAAFTFSLPFSVKVANVNEKRSILDSLCLSLGIHVLVLRLFC